MTYSIALIALLLLLSTLAAWWVQRPSTLYDEANARLRERRRAIASAPLRSPAQITTEAPIMKEDIHPRIRALYLGEGAAEEAASPAPVPLRHGAESGLFIAAGFFDRPGAHRTWANIQTRDGSYSGKKEEPAS